MADQGKLPRPPRRPSEDLEDDEWVSHYGRALERSPSFYDGPRLGRDRGELSMVRGKRDAQETAQLVMHWRNPPFDDALVRHAQVGKLRDKGFVVEHTPSPTNEHHVSVSLPDKPHTWPEDVQNALEVCFEDEGGGGRP